MKKIAFSRAAYSAGLLPDEPSKTDYSNPVAALDQVSALARGEAPFGSDIYLSDSFAEKHTDHFTFDAYMGRWFEFDGKLWIERRDTHLFEAARPVCLEAVARNETLPEKLRISGRALAGAKTIAAVEKLARGRLLFAGRWDADPFLLNTPGGTVDLRTGELRPHRAQDYMTKMTATAPGGDCPRWLQFLDEVTNGNAELQSFLQRMMGYTLTGDINEHALFYFYGTGKNGKSVLRNTCSWLMGGYSQEAVMSLLMEAKHERHSTELAMLRGLRLVTSAETKQGAWDENRLKQLTGGDPITARFMRQDNFTFQPEFKLVISGNNKPSIRTVDEAIRRRFFFVPFTVTIPEEKRDKYLAEKTLKAEWPGILQWMIDGCIDWRERGLAPPEAVMAATAEYMASQDRIALWIEECCEVGPVADSIANLFASYVAWLARCGEKSEHLTKHELGDALVERNFIKAKNVGLERGRGHRGIKVKVAEPEEPPPPRYWDR